MKSHKCARCGVAAPPSASAFSLIGTKHGWRVARRRDSSGDVTLDWFCQPCWKIRKDKALIESREPDSEAGRSFKSAIASLKGESGSPTR